MYCSDLQEKGLSDEISLAEFVGLCSALGDISVRESTVVVGEITLSGTMMSLTILEDIVRVAVNAGAKRILLPNDSMKDFYSLSSSLTQKIQALPYMNPAYYRKPSDC